MSTDVNDELRSENRAGTMNPVGPSGILALCWLKLHTFSLLGIDALAVEVEVDVSPGALPKTVLVGLPERRSKKARIAIERAMVNSGFVRPQDRVVINFAPAELPKRCRIVRSADCPWHSGRQRAIQQ